MASPRLVDLFAGAGGFSAGLMKVGFDPIFAVEIDKHACQTYRANHPNTDLFSGNIANLPNRGLLKRLGLGRGELELLVGGPPCQGFSTVGKKDASDPRNRLFEEYFRIVAALRPSFVIFENVAGFKRMYGGRAFQAVVSEFGKLNYDVRPQILNALDYGVPQNRLRTIVVGVSRGRSFEWPKKTHERKPLKLKDAVSDLPLIKSGESATHYASKAQNTFQRAMRKGIRTLTEHVGPNHGAHIKEVMTHAKKEGDTILSVPQRLRPRSYFSNTYARLWWDRPSPTVTRNLGTPSSSRCIHPKVDRGLTTREGARLQSFDDSFLFYGTRSSKNLQIGNAVPPLLAKALGESILQGLKRPVKKVSKKSRSLFSAPA